MEGRGGFLPVQALLLPVVPQEGQVWAQLGRPESAQALSLVLAPPQPVDPWQAASSAGQGFCRHFLCSCELLVASKYTPDALLSHIS